MGLPAAMRRENKEWDRLHPRPPVPYYFTREELAPLKIETTFDPFSTKWIIDGIEQVIQLRPEPGNPKIDRLPTLFSVGIEGGSHYGWLTIADGQWRWFSNERPQEFAEQIGEWIVVGHYG